MEKEMLKEIEKVNIDKIVLNCYYNICKYYNINNKIIEKYITTFLVWFWCNFGVKQSFWCNFKQMYKTIKASICNTF